MERRRAPLDLGQHTEKEVLMNLVPRVEDLERDVDEQIARQDRLDAAITTLREDLQATEARLRTHVDQTFGTVDEHLDAQDRKLDKIADVRRQWAIAILAAVIALGAAWIAHAHG